MQVFLIDLSIRNKRTKLGILSMERRVKKMAAKSAKIYRKKERDRMVENCALHVDFLLYL